MIVVKLIGGLGNQMFQYAAGRALAHHHETDLFLDTTALGCDTEGAYTPRNYELGVFNIKAQMAGKTLLEYFDTDARVKNKIKSYFPSLCKSLVYNESGFSFDQRFFSLPASTYLNGYWQNEKYFSGIGDMLKKELSLRNLSDPHVAVFSHVSEVNSISIHVRRGDYLTSGPTSSFHGVLPLDYYRDAITHFADRHDDAVFFVFSDDIPWCECNFGFIKNVSFVSGERLALTAQEELMLMSSCRHNIIANSSFSWWAAWLNKNETKTVIAPKVWFYGSEQQPSELIPSGWLRL